MSESGQGIAAAAAAAAGGPTFLDNVCIHLASTLLGSTAVTDILTTAADAYATRPHQLYWRSPILSPLSVLQSSTSPVVSQEAQSRVVYVDLTVWFLPPADSDSSKANAAKRPRVRAKFGALVRHWHPIRLDAGSGVIDRTCRPNGGTYVQQDRYLSKRGLREYGDSINIDLESMESRPTARLLGKAMGGTGLRAEVVANGNDPPKVVVTIDHQSLTETGSFAIVNDNTDDDSGRIGETPMSMLLANIEAESRRTSSARSASSATNDSSPGAKTRSATISGVDPEEENEMRRVFEQWWGRMMRGENASSSVSKEKSDSSRPSIPMETTSRSSAQVAVVANGERSDNTKSTRATTTHNATGIGEEREAGLERKSPAQTPASDKEQQTQANSSSLAVANDVKENVKNDSARATSTSAAAAKIGNDISTGKDVMEEKTSTSPSQIQKKKRKTPGPILVRAGGGRKKKKKGKITIGKSV